MKCGQGGYLLRASWAQGDGGMGWRWCLLSPHDNSRWGWPSLVLRRRWRSQRGRGTLEMLHGRLLGHGRQQNDAAVLSSSLRAAMSKNGREVTKGVLFIRAWFLACLAWSPHHFFLQFEACLFFSWDLRKISWVGEKLIALIRTPYELGDRALGGSCEKEYGVVRGCGAGGVGHGTRMELSTMEGDRRHAASSSRGTGLGPG
jgi:hypothetical protein